MEKAYCAEEAALAQQLERARKALAAARMGKDVDKAVSAYNRYKTVKERFERARAGS